MTFDARPATSFIEDEIAAMFAASPPDSRAAVLYAPGNPTLNLGHHEVAFVLSNLPGWQTLAAGLPAGVEVVLLDGQRDGLAQMADWLAQRPPGSVDAIHLLGHGSAGAIELGSLTLNASNLGEHADELARIGAALTDDGDWLLYGCNVAAGAAGQNFIDRLAQSSGADVAASNDLTGAAALGGDWQLELASGPVQAAPADISVGLTGYGYTLASIAAQTTVDFNTAGASWVTGPGVSSGLGTSFTNNGFTFSSSTSLGGYNNFGVGGSPSVSLSTYFGSSLTITSAGATFKFSSGYFSEGIGDRVY